MSRIDIEIDRVVLRGLDPADQRAFVTELKSELSRGLADPAGAMKSPASQQTAVLRVGKLTLESGPNGARKLGGRVANAITMGIRR